MKLRAVELQADIRELDPTAARGAEGNEDAEDKVHRSSPLHSKMIKAITRKKQMRATERTR
jgi:hypothetical protein